MVEHANGSEDPKETVRKEWEGAAPLWKKWYEKFEIQTAAATRLIVENSRLEPGLKVLDLASGTGEPALSVAKAVGPNGEVTATDFVPEMLRAAIHQRTLHRKRRRALRRIRTIRIRQPRTTSRQMTMLLRRRRRASLPRRSSVVIRSRKRRRICTGKASRRIAIAGCGCSSPPRTEAIRRL